MFLDHTQRRSTVCRTPLDEWSARRRDLYLTTHDTHDRQISMPPVGFEPTISAGERPAIILTLRDTTWLHDRLDNDRTMEGQTFLLSTALILPQLKCDQRLSFFFHLIYTTWFFYTFWTNFDNWPEMSVTALILRYWWGVLFQVLLIKNSPILDPFPPLSAPQA